MGDARAIDSGRNLDEDMSCWCSFGYQHTATLARWWFIETLSCVFSPKCKDAGDALSDRAGEFVPFRGVVSVRDQTVCEPTDIRARMQTRIFDLDIGVRAQQT